MVRQAHHPWFDRLTNHGSAGSPTVNRQIADERKPDRVKKPDKFLF
jgi:hypothetical protein